tara:strand:- start:988 stop:1413 length:426 start_codon:yes stop_codon:yes gene_type:complete
MAGARQNDLNPNTYIGLALPLKSDNNNVFQLTKNSFDQVRHNLKNLLLTNIGERVYQPEFGSRLRQICFEQLDDSLPTRVEDEVRRAVGFWLPYVNIESVETLTEEDNKAKIFVRVTFSTTLNSETLQQIELDASYTAERL